LPVKAKGGSGKQNLYSISKAHLVISKNSRDIINNMADPMNSLAGVTSNRPPSLKNLFAIAGIQVNVFGLNELLSQGSEVACLWLLHPRLVTKESMASIVKATICDWNDKKKEISTSKGLIAVSFDQRNHGTRMIDPLANEAWRQGNPRHAQDTFSIFRKPSYSPCNSATLTETHIGYCPRYISVDGLSWRVRLPQR
jgi:hypothetical protein